MYQATIGSLFDGIGGFPLLGLVNGFDPKWASEIEEFPMCVTRRHIPSMRHIGDCTKVNGAELEPVDLLTFGSPCQNLSVAGNRKGLGLNGKYKPDKPVRTVKRVERSVEGFRRRSTDTQSGLFFEAVRIIREMREATNGQFPRFALWENVPGAFSSNYGRDFRAVIEELLGTEVPVPKSGQWIKTKSGAMEWKIQWANAGMVRGNGCSLAWRVLDSQHWGVPQRRRRIFLVVDFRGQSAPEVLFESESVSGDFEESREREERPCLHFWRRH